jgi:Uma2 family endonuclease
MVVQRTRRRFTVDEYHAMARAGILDEGDRIELIAGEIVEKPPIGPERAGSVGGAAELPMRRLGDRAHVRAQSPIRLDERNEPEPDIVVLVRRPDFYRSAHPRAAEVLLVMAVADSSATSDRATKLPRYAGAGIAEAWLVDLVHGRVEVHREPGPDGYRLVRYSGRGDQVSPEAFPDCTLTADELLVS